MRLLDDNLVNQVFDECAVSANAQEARGRCYKHPDGWWTISWDYYTSNTSECRRFWDAVNDRLVTLHNAVQIGGFNVRSQKQTTEWQAGFRYFAKRSDADPSRHRWWAGY